MKKNQVIVRILIMTVIAFGVDTTASAQFGGLLKKAKSAVKDKVDNKTKMSNFEAKDALNQAIKGNVPSSNNSDSDEYSSESENSESSSNLGAISLSSTLTCRKPSTRIGITPLVALP